MKNPFLHRLMKDKKENIVHSSVYARAQSKGGMGADSTESFAARRAIDAKRKAVRRYDESRMVNESGVRATWARKREVDEKNVDTNNGCGLGRVGAGERSAEKAMEARKFMEPSSGRSAAKPPVRRNPGISR